MTLKGKVIHGKGLGHKIGFPTANILLEEGHLPGSGVYASTITVSELSTRASARSFERALEETSKKYNSITNIGTRPTVDDSNATTIETHILNFNADIYEKKVVLEIGDFIRPIKKFDSIEELKVQIKKDLEKVGS